MKVLNIAGARPNFMKVAPLHRALGKYPDIVSKIVHTGQHHDFSMSGIFFKQLGMPAPDYNLGVGGGTHASQTAHVMLEFEKVINLEKPDLIIVVGDVNATLACALVAVKADIPVAHVEAGLRSGDRRMPEEINRIVTDSISDELFVTEKSAVDNLLRENISDEKIHWVGNVMIDSLVYCLPEIERADVLGKLDLQKRSYTVFTTHRPANVDTLAGLTGLLSVLRSLTRLQTVLFPVHPRTWKNINLFGLKTQFESVPFLRILEPKGYFEFVKLVMESALVVTDSGGIQEETTYLGIPCITLRENTERPVTVAEGTNYLLPGFNAPAVSALAAEILSGRVKKGAIPVFWDGNTASRIAAILKEKYFNSYVCDR